MIANQRVLEAVSKLTGTPVAELKRQMTPRLHLPVSMDSLDRVELVMELEDEFDDETVRWALRYIEVLAQRPESRLSDEPSTLPIGGRDPLWDRELDG